jgi:hypothetical protein
MRSHCLEDCPDGAPYGCPLAACVCIPADTVPPKRRMPLEQILRMALKMVF